MYKVGNSFYGRGNIIASGLRTAHEIPLPPHSPLQSFNARATLLVAFFISSTSSLYIILTTHGTLTLITTPPRPLLSESLLRTLRGTIGFPLKRFSTEFATEVQVFLALLIKSISGEAEAGETRPGWMRVLAMEIMRGCVFLFLS